MIAFVAVLAVVAIAVAAMTALVVDESRHADDIPQAAVDG